MNAVATPARNPIILAPIKAGILPYWSAIHPKINPPNMAPMKKILWATVGKESYWQTHPSYSRKLQSNDLLLDNEKYIKFFKIELKKRKEFVNKTSSFEFLIKYNSLIFFFLLEKEIEFKIFFFFFKKRIFLKFFENFLSNKQYKNSLE